ncbi:ABC transporter substrate-binding protein [Actinoplanes utahensis]|uniref:ABC transporter substrate-binding protein n=1 Tax=Actinoplanes utahensis TaxID=1869 RepID=A0A0A6XE73_ACTUT|nr:ABC transporter substrate-binding protein [Actinoplanes utahensis]GIF29001.1 ABC transporter [Actinoplanes utahensis]
MARRARLVVAAAAAVTLGIAGCGSPSSNSDKSKAEGGKIETATQTIDAAAKGPAEEIPGAKKGGTVTVYQLSTVTTIDPTDTYYVDANEIGKLLYRTPTTYDIRNGQPVLVPDLTDLGTASADGLTWTFKLQPNIKYHDGTPIKVEDLAYAIKRSFAHDVYSNGPTYQMSYFKDGDKYKGPYADKGPYSGVETQGTDTLIIHLKQPFSDLPFYMTFPMFTPIPEAKDTKQEYQLKPMATGPYQVESYSVGSELKLVKNTNWDPNTDPVRHQYLDSVVFKWGQEDVKTQQQVLNSNGEDANAINTFNIDATLVPQLTGKESQLLQGASPCTRAWSIDTRKVPLEVRKALAVAWPYDGVWKANGYNPYTAERASTIMPPSVPGYTKYTPAEGLSGEGAGDPAKAKQMLEAAGKSGFEISWYFDNQKTVPQQVANTIATALNAAGFKAKPIGIPSADLRKKGGDYDAPVNFGQTPRGWCSDWPTGNSWFPVLFRSQSVEEGQSWGMLQDKALDEEINALTKLPSSESTAKWGALDKKIMDMYVAIPMTYEKTAVVFGKNVGMIQNDPTMGFPFLPDLHLKS